MHFFQLCRKISTKNLEKFRFKTEEDCEKKTLFSKKMFFMKTLLWTSNCSSENRSQKLRVKSPKMVCLKFENETKTFLLERHISNQNISLERKKSILTKLLKNATEGPEQSTLQSEKCWTLIHFFKTKFPSFCSAGGKSALLTRLPHSFCHKTEKFSLKSRNGWRIEKNLIPVVFPRKDPLAARVQFCKPCLRNFCRKWSWINQNTKRTNKICTLLTKKTGKRSLDTQERFRQLWQSFPAGIQEFFHSKSRNGRTILILCRKEISSNRSSGYVDCRIDKTDKIVFVDCSKLHRLKSVKEKIWYRSKKRLFLQNVSVDTWIAIFSKLAKSCRKTFKQHMLQIRIWEKINNFKKQFFPGIMLLWTIEMQFWTSCQNVSTKYLEEIPA